ncbi:hypothetical protein [Filimonas effusa]|uniref:Uncharacterized protein n=1 Tax=Filimonas effusa TaxID=2508721 RepID=A0A4Q1DBF8_9BACT|nr:hypothetical protein [Filimonas effusa]RXK86767.1 hypothetical protein ESB13_08205 [Filimonas effusa]
MKSYLNSFAIALFFLCSVINCSGQDSSSREAAIPLHLYLQQQHDSTIIYFPFEKAAAPRYYIIGKSGNAQLSLYTYVNPYRAARNYPPEVLKKFIKESTKFTFTLPDTNRYFIPYRNLKSEEGRKIWDSVIVLTPWMLKDDAVEGEGCGKGAKCNTYDDWMLTFFLITKSGIRKIYFYAPEFYEQCCPGREGRQKAVQLERLFKEVFKLDKM